MCICMKQNREEKNYLRVVVPVVVGLAHKMRPKSYIMEFTGNHQLLTLEKDGTPVFIFSRSEQRQLIDIYKR